jgi:hypothetical protein
VLFEYGTVLPFPQEALQPGDAGHNPEMSIPTVRSSRELDKMNMRVKEYHSRGGIETLEE